MTGRVISFPQRSRSLDESRANAQRLLQHLPLGISSQVSRQQLEDPETLLCLCGELRDQLDKAPSGARDGAAFVYQFLETPPRPIGLFDEREYYLGEFALLAGTACRHLSRRDEARIWFDRAESGFRHTVNATADLARLAYQRLALRMEERQLDVVLELVPSLVQSFERLEMREDALKSRFLEGLALMEGEKLEKAREVFERICRDAEILGNQNLLGLGYTNLIQVFGLLGDSENAIETSRRAVPALSKAGNRIGLAKVQWGLAILLRETGQLQASIEAYRTAQREFGLLEMRADVAALHLVIADLLLDLGHEREAIPEVLSALPVIDELRMVPEGVAALSLLRESVRQQRINREALRDLHGYFEDLK